MTYSETVRDSKESFAHNYTDTSLEELIQKTHEWFLGEGYLLNEGTSGNGNYVKGNRTARLLLGAFYKYFAFDVRVFNESPGVSVDVKKSTTGMSGGAIGVNQVRKEMQRVKEALKAL